MNYEDFDVLIQPLGRNQYRTLVINSPCGQATTEFKTPFSRVKMENFLLRLGQRRRGVRRVESAQMDSAKELGKRLFDTVFGGQIQTCLLNSIDKASQHGSGLRIRLRLHEVPQLADVPWEYLYNPTLNRFYSLSDRTPIVRYLDMPESVKPLSVKSPLRVLVMIASPSDYEPLNVNREWDMLRDALADLVQQKQVTLDLVEKSTLDSLRRKLRTGVYNVFHFIGHGGYDKQADEGLLVLEDDAGHSKQISAQVLSIVLQTHDHLRLAVLNACEGAQGSVTDPFSGTAQSFVQQGIPAVIAMQFDITDDAAITFSHEFYTGIAAGLPVDAALAASRLAIFTAGYGLEWGTPVLYMRSTDACIFEVEQTTEAEPTVQPPVFPAIRSNFIMPVGAISPNSSFYIERAADQLALYEIQKNYEGATISIIGPRQAGKTSLLYRLIDAAVKVNKRVAFLDFQQIGNADLSNADVFFRRFCRMITRELEIEDRLDRLWDSSAGVIQTCSDYVRDYILEESNGPVVLAMDEVETVFGTEFRSDFFAMLRNWHNMRALPTDDAWKKIDLVIVSSSEPHYFIENLSQSPFNVATEVQLSDFKPEQVAELNTRYGSPLNTEEVAKLVSRIGGHPYLVHLSIYWVASGRRTTDDLFMAVTDDQSPYYGYMQNLLLRLQSKDDMARCLRQVMDSNRCKDLRMLFRLQSAGLVRREGISVVMRCKIYDDFFREYINV